MEFFDALKQVEKATLNKRDDSLYLRWITGGYDKEISFSVYSEQSKNDVKETLETIYWNNNLK